MRPVLFSIGSVNIYGYGLMIAIGIVLAFVISQKLAKRCGVNDDVLFNGGLIGVIAGLLGAKITYWIIEWDTMMADPSLFLQLDGGFVVIGGLVAGVGVPILYVTVIKKMDILGMLDIAAVVIPLAQACGRIGCFFSGCCYGAVAPEGAWYALVFPEGGSAPAGVGLYPTQLISSFGDLCIFGILLWRLTRNRFEGQNLSLYMVLYAVGRFLVEYLRADDRGDFIGPFSPSQFMSLFIFAGGIILWFVFRAIGRPSLKKVEKKPEAAA